jgi:fumagillin biosynthesis cytochrome P450 monooxygenase
MTYGYVVEPDKPDPLVQIVEQMMHEISLAATPLKWPVDIVPALKHLPESLPGMSWKRIAREWHKIASTVIEVPYAFVQEQMKKGDYKPSFVSSIIEQRESSSTGDDEKSMGNDEDIRYTAATMYAAGADTTVLSLKSLILAMLLFPEVQTKAQKEIDTVIGTNTLPGIEDRERLPYVNALAKEAFRWLPVVPMGLSHVADEDIDFKDVHIPKGSFLLPAIWWFLHNPEIHADPHSFDPERYLEPRNEPDPMGETFGYGRRICPGRFLADEVVFITIARLLATHDLKKAVDGRGAEIEPKIDVTTGLISHLLDFPYSIKPRSKHYADLVRSVEAEIPREDGDAGRLSFDGGWV